MNRIPERSAQMPYRTDMRAILAAAGTAADDCDGYVGDVETNRQPPARRGDAWPAAKRLAPGTSADFPASSSSR